MSEDYTVTVYMTPEGLPEGSWDEDGFAKPCACILCAGERLTGDETPDGAEALTTHHASAEDVFFYLADLGEPGVHRHGDHGEAYFPVAVTYARAAQRLTYEQLKALAEEDRQAGWTQIGPAMWRRVSQGAS